MIEPHLVQLSNSVAFWDCWVSLGKAKGYRRVSLPKGTFQPAIYFMRQDDGTLDALTRERASEDRCSYAEALTSVLLDMEERDLAAPDDEATIWSGHYEIFRARFVKEQTRREGLWRASRQLKGATLLPVFD